MIEKLAIEGGEPVRKTPIFWMNAPAIEEEEINNAVETLKSRVLSPIHGTRCFKLQEVFADYLGLKRAVLCSSGTAADHVVIAALKIGPGEEVIVPPIGMVASALGPVFNNAIPIFADVDPKWGMIDAEDLRKKITDRTKAIMVTHWGGHPADLNPILEVAEEKGLPVIEDFAQAIGATYKGKKCGAVTVEQQRTINCASFVWSKTITTGGEGGVVVTNDDELADYAFSFVNHGRPAKNYKEYIYEIIGWNYRLTEVQCAIGLAQVPKIDRFVKARRENANYLTKHLEHLNGIELPHEPPWGTSSWFCYTMHVDEDELGVKRDRLVEALNAEGIHCYCTPNDSLWPIFTERRGYGKTHCPWSCPFYGREVNYEKMCPKGQKYCQTTFNIGIGPMLTKEDLDCVITAIEKVVTTYYKRKK